MDGHSDDEEGDQNVDDIEADQRVFRTREAATHFYIWKEKNIIFFECSDKNLTRNGRTFLLFLLLFRLELILHSSQVVTLLLLFLLAGQWVGTFRTFLLFLLLRCDDLRLSEHLLLQLLDGEALVRSEESLLCRELDGGVCVVRGSLQRGTVAVQVYDGDPAQSPQLGPERETDSAMWTVRAVQSWRLSQLCTGVMFLHSPLTHLRLASCVATIR